MRKAIERRVDLIFRQWLDNTPVTRLSISIITRNLEKSICAYTGGEWIEDTMDSFI